MNNFILLLKLNLLSTTKNSIFAKLFFRKKINVNHGIFIKVLGFCSFLFIFFIIAFSSYGLSFFEPLIHEVVNYKHLVLYLFWIFPFYFGLFTGANLIYEFTILDNFRYLSLPILTIDLVGFRVAESILKLVKFFFYFLLPIYLLIYIYMGLGFYYIIVYTILLHLIYLSTYLYGNIFILFIAKKIRNVSSDKFFIAIFLSSVWIFIIVFRLIKTLRTGTVLSKFLNTLDSFFTKFSLIEIIESTFSTKQMFLLFFIFTIFFMSLINYLLIRLFHRLLLNAYNNIHFKPIDNKATYTKKNLSFDFKKLYAIFKFFSAELRIIFVKDLVVLLRKPYFLLKVLFFIFIFGSFSSYFSSKLISTPKLLFMYILPSFIVSRFFIHSIGLERSNILLIKQLYPSTMRFLMNRAKINLIISSFVVVPIWILFIIIDPKLLLSNIILRFLLLLLNLVFCTFLLTGYSATFAIFKEKNLEYKTFGVPPSAILLYFAFGLCVPLLFYLVDISFTITVFRTLLNKLIVILGLFSFISTIVFFYVGNRKIKNFY